MQQSVMPLLQTGSRPITSTQVGVEPAGHKVPDEQAPVPEEDEEELEEELEEDELVVVEQTKLELHMELSVPLLAQHRGVPPRKEQVVP